MAKIKIPIKTRRRIAGITSWALSTLALIVVFFEFFLTTHGDWDDVNIGAVFAAPLFAGVSLVFAIINIVSNRSKSKEVFVSLAAVALSAIFFCYVMLYTSVVLLAKK